MIIVIEHSNVRDVITKCNLFKWNKCSMKFSQYKDIHPQEVCILLGHYRLQDSDLVCVLTVRTHFGALHGFWLQLGKCSLNKCLEKATAIAKVLSTNSATSLGKIVCMVGTQEIFFGLNENNTDKMAYKIISLHTSARDDTAHSAKQQTLYKDVVQRSSDSLGKACIVILYTNQFLSGARTFISFTQGTVQNSQAHMKMFYSI